MENGSAQAAQSVKNHLTGYGPSALGSGDTLLDEEEMSCSGRV